MVDETECRKIVEMVERRLQLLARRGPRWRQPTVTEVLSGTAFLRGAPPKIVDWIRHNSTIKVYPQVRTRPATLQAPTSAAWPTAARSVSTCSVPCLIRGM